MITIPTQPLIPYPSIFSLPKPQFQPSSCLINPVFSPIEGSNLLKEAFFEFRRIFASKLPKSDNRGNLHRYIKHIIANEKNMDLKDKYICSIYISWNKNLLYMIIVKMKTKIILNLIYLWGS